MTTSKIKTLAHLKSLLATQRKKVVLANGCFDILHVGHVRYLEGAKDLGDILIVAINSDKSARQLKGEGRPVTNEKERAEIISSLGCVDYVTIFDEPDVSNIILSLKPNIQAKGTDYTAESVPEAETVKSYGGRVAITGDPKNHSSSDIIKNIGRP